MDNNRELERHLTTEQLLDYIERRLSFDEIGQVETHLASDCSSCQEELTWLTETLNLMAPDLWVDAPVRLQASARQIYRNHFSPKPERVSIAQWLQSLFAPRRPLVYAAFGLLLLVLVTGLLLLPWSSSEERASVEVAAFQGTVEVQSLGADTWESAESAGEINAGDDVRTGDESSVVLSFPDQSKTLMAPHTELRILKMSLDEESGDQIIILRQDFGRTQNYVQPMPSTGSRFEIQTPAATVTVHGTSFSVEVEDDGTTRVAVSEGRVQVSAQGMTIALDAGEATEVVFGSAPSVAQPAPTVPIPTEFATVFTPAPKTTDEPSGEVEATATAQPPAMATNTLTPSPTASPSPLPSLSPSPSPLAVYATSTPTPTPEPTSGPGPGPTEPPPTKPPPTKPPTQPTNTPEGPPPSSTPVPPATATTEPPPPSPTEDPWVPPGQTKTPEPPGQTREAPGGGKKTG